MYLVRSSYLIKKLYPKALWRGTADQKKIYLSFDDGPAEGVTGGLLDLLKEKNVKATFFCVGQNAVKYPELFQRILQEGHAVGNHTHTHVNGWNTATDVYLENTLQCKKALESQGFRSAGEGKPLFRPPYGKLKRSQYSILRLQYSIVMWDVLSGDYDKNTSPEKCLKNVIDTTRNGSVIVFHDSLKALKNMEYAVPRFIEDALAKGYEFCLLSAGNF